jgi:hypothetical protein
VLNLKPIDHIKVTRLIDVLYKLNVYRYEKKATRLELIALNVALSVYQG